MLTTIVAPAAPAPGRRQLAFRVGESMIGRRRNQDREVEPLPEELQAGVERADIDEDAGLQAEGVEGLPIAAERDLVCGSPGNVVVRHLGEALPGERLVLEQIHGCERGRSALAAVAVRAAGGRRDAMTTSSATTPSASPGGPRCGFYSMAARCAGHRPALNRRAS